MTTPDDSGTHATLADSGDNTDSQELPRGSNLGRYVIIEPIGSGGMGTVYRAYDPQLNRGVALKILSVKHADIQAAERAKARLIREAQALAQLSHPNVVAVHDAGTFEDDVFIAMELVEGKTLDEWLRQEKRTVKEILEVMTAAGRGLSAAHKAGLIHRDFKPGNVMIGDDGRIRVLDFGLARTAEQQESDEEVSVVPESSPGTEDDSKDSFDLKEISSDSSPNLLQSPLTQAGGILGTPMYMAPEQYLGLKTDERTDQFGFCVVLYEALYGNRPFSGRSMEELKGEVIRQRVRDPKYDSNVPSWLWKIVRKGLSVKPKDRYPTIEALLEGLEQDPEEVRRQQRLVRRRKLYFVSLILFTIALPFGVWYGLRHKTVQLCKKSEAEFEGVWDKATKAMVQKAFLGTKKTYALGTWERVERNFDRFLSDWRQMRSEVCEARHILGTQSEELFDLRMTCLKDRRLELKALVNVFTDADSSVVQKAIPASSSISEIGICADEKAMRAPYPPPKTKEEQTKVNAIREKLAEVEALEKTGKYQEGLELAKKLDEEVKAFDYQLVKAEVLFQLGVLFQRNGEYVKAEEILNDAAHMAGEGRSGLLVAKSMIVLVRVVGYQQARFTEGMQIAKDSEFVLGLSGGNDALRAKLLNNLASVLWTKGSYSKALEYFRKAQAINEKVFGPEHLNVATSLHNLGLVFNRIGKYDKAMEYYRRSLSIRKKELGLEHPRVANSFNNMGNVFQNQGRYKKATEYHHKALAIKEKSLGPNHPSVAVSMTNLGDLFFALGEKDKALECYRRALFIDEKTRGPENPLLVWSLVAIGNLFVTQKQPKQALNPFERVVSICEMKACEPEMHSYGLFGLAKVLLATGGGKVRAINLAKQAGEIFKKTPKRFKKELAEVNTWLQKHGAKKLAKKVSP